MPDLRAASYKVNLSPDDPRVVGLKARPEDEKYGIYVGYEPATQKWTLLTHKRPTSTIIRASKPISEVVQINFSTADVREQPSSRLLINNGDMFKVASGTGGINAFLDGRCVAAGILTMIRILTSTSVFVGEHH